MMEKFYDIFSNVALAIILLGAIIASLAFLKATVKESRQIDEDIRKRKAEALRKEKEISAFIKAS